MSKIPLLVLALLVVIPPMAADAKGVLVVAPKAATRRGKRVARAAHKVMLRHLQEVRDLEVTALDGRRAKGMWRCIKRPECVRKIGKRLQTELMLISVLRQRGRRLVVSVALVDMRSAEEVARDRFSGRRGRASLRKVGKMAGRLLGGVQTTRVPPRQLLQPVAQAADDENPD